MLKMLECLKSNGQLCLEGVGLNGKMEMKLSPKAERREEAMERQNLNIFCHLKEFSTDLDIMP
jgi:hypothetical protein